jgi:hypothetical protein
LERPQGAAGGDRYFGALAMTFSRKRCFLRLRKDLAGLKVRGTCPTPKLRPPGGLSFLFFGGAGGIESVIKFRFRHSFIHQFFLQRVCFHRLRIIEREKSGRYVMFSFRACPGPRACRGTSRRRCHAFWVWRRRPLERGAAREVFAEKRESVRAVRPKRLFFSWVGYLC